MEGTVKKLMPKGYGFIEVEEQDDDVFFHSNELEGASFEELKEGDKLSFELVDSEKGPNAVNVTRA